MAARLDEGYQYKLGSNFPIVYDTVKNKKNKELLNPIQYKTKKSTKNSRKHSTNHNIHKSPVVNTYLSGDKSGVIKLNSEEKF